MSVNKSPQPPLQVVCSGNTQSHAVRIPPNADLVPSLLDAAQQAMEQSQSQSAFVMTAVGSLTEVTLRMAATNDEEGVVVPSINEESGSDGKKRKTVPSMTKSSPSLRIRTFLKHFEIVSLVGTFSPDDQGKVTLKHLHMSLSDSDGTVIGGHLVSGRVYTTLELVLGTIQGVAFAREVITKKEYGFLWDPKDGLLSRNLTPH